MQVLTYHNDNTREGQNTQETILTPTNVNSSTFGKVGFYSTDGKVDAEPLYVPGVTIGGATHNVLYVVTENDSAYAFDADSGHRFVACLYPRHRRSRERPTEVAVR